MKNQKWIMRAVALVFDRERRRHELRRTNQKLGRPSSSRAIPGSVMN